MCHQRDGGGGLALIEREPPPPAGATYGHRSSDASHGASIGPASWRAVAHYFFEPTLITRPFACGVLGNVTVKTPLSTAALIASTSTVLGSVNER